MAAKDMEEYLPGVPLDATLVEATEDGFDVLASDGVTSLVHVVVERWSHQPLRPGDPVVATVAGVGLEGDLLHEGRQGEWVVRARTGGDQQPVEEMKVPASDVTFSWRVGRDMWMKAVRLAPLRLAARKADWLGIGSLEQSARMRRQLGGRSRQATRRRCLACRTSRSSTARRVDTSRVSSLPSWTTAFNVR